MRKISRPLLSLVRERTTLQTKTGKSFWQIPKNKNEVTTNNNNNNNKKGNKGISNQEIKAFYFFFFKSIWDTLPKSMASNKKLTGYFPKEMIKHDIIQVKIDLQQVNSAFWRLTRMHAHLLKYTRIFFSFLLCV